MVPFLPAAGSGPVIGPPGVSPSLPTGPPVMVISERLLTKPTWIIRTEKFWWCGGVHKVGPFSVYVCACVCVRVCVCVHMCPREFICTLACLRNEINSAFLSVRSTESCTCSTSSYGLRISF